MKTSIEIAQEATLTPIEEIRDKVNVESEDFEPFGKYVGKLRLQILDKLADKPNGKLILVTAMTPTRFGEGKTLTSVGLGQALQHIGKDAIIALREPSLGPVFGIKGGAAGGGYSQVLPMEQINLHFTGDIHAITAAHNLLAAMLDNHLLKGNELDLDVNQIWWPRTMDMNDRALREMVIGLGGRIQGVPRETGFIITAASEIMAILALTTSRSDLKERLGNIVVGLNRKGEPVTARDLKANNAMAVLLNQAIMPNLVQTIEHSPALIHAGPFANIAHGTSSVLGTKIALKLADYVVTEAGFGADLGAEKFFNIVSRQAGFYPAGVVLVATCRAIKHHGGVGYEALSEENSEAFAKGMANLERHLLNIMKFGVPVVVAINNFPWDTESEVEAIQAMCQTHGVTAVVHRAFTEGGKGAAALATAVVDAVEGKTSPSQTFLYDLEDDVETKIKKIATGYYGAESINIEAPARKKIADFVRLGYGNLPICVAKTQNSFSDNPKALGAPTGWELTVTDISLSAGAGFLVVICGNMMRMPGLPTIPAAVNIDVDDEGNITGLF